MDTNSKIFIDVDDEITFVAERVLTARSMNVILVVPEKALLLSSLASLKLLNHVVEKSGKRVVIVTMDDTGKILSTKAGFRTRNRVGEVEQGIWEEFIESSVHQEQNENIVAEPIANEDMGAEAIPEENIESTESIEPVEQEEQENNLIQEEESTLEDTSIDVAQAPDISDEDSHEGDNLLDGTSKVDEQANPEEPIAESDDVIAQEDNLDGVDSFGEIKSMGPLPKVFPDLTFLKKDEGELKEKESEKGIEEEKPISLDEAKAKNLSVYEINSLNSEDNHKENIIEPMAKPEVSKPRYVESVRIVKLDGFDLVVGGDAAVIKKSKEIERRVVARKADTISSLHLDSRDTPAIGIIGQDVEPNISKKKITKFPIFLMPFMEKLQELHKKHGGHFRKWMIAPIVICLIAILVLWYYLFSSAVVAVGVKSRPLSATVDVTANVNNSNVNAKNSTIPGYVVDINESSSSSLNTTGTKQVGQNATGTINVYNNTSNSITIPKGTVFLTNDTNAYQYILSADLTIAAANGAPQSQSSTLSAKNFGAQYNIPSGTAFTIQDSSLPTQGVTASSTQAFTGGTSSTAQVVAQADQDNLLKSLETQLYQKGGDEIVTKIGNNEVEIKDSLKNEDVTKSFDSNVGDKASILNLSLTTKTSVLTYSTNDINEFAKDYLSESLKSDETLRNLQTTVTYKGFDSKTNNVALSISISASATPQLSSTSIVNAIKRKTTGSAQNYINSINGVKRVSISISPFWLSWSHFMPARSGNIKINISTE